MKKRLTNIDLLRIICCFAVVLIHVAVVVWYDYDFHSFNWKVSSFFNSLARFSVPVFYMISGMLFLSREKINIKKIYKKNIKNILIIIAIWLPIHAVFYHYKYGQSIESLASLKEVLRGMVSNQYQFWFLFPLITIYIMLPVLKKIVEDKKVCKYYLIIFFIFEILRKTLMPYIGTGAKLGLYNLFTPELVLGYFGYFVLGYYLYTNELTKKQKNISYILGIASVIFATLGTIIITYDANTLTDTYFGYSQITTFFASIAIFNLFKYEISKINFKQKSQKIISKLSELTMGVYIFHNLIKSGLEIVGIDTYFAPAIISVPLLTILIFIICLGITYIIKKIPLIGKYIV